MDYLETTLKLLTGLLALLFIIRLLGKKELGQFSPFDFIYLLLLGSVIEEALYDEKVSVWLMLYNLALWTICIYIIEKIAQKNDVLKRLLKGSPAIIMQNGKFDLQMMEKNHLEFEQIRQKLRQQGIFSLREVRDLYLEPNGMISVMKKAEFEPPSAAALKIKLQDEAPSIILIEEGMIKEKNLREIKQSKEWLVLELNKLGHSHIEDVLYCEWSKTEGFLIKTY